MFCRNVQSLNAVHASGVQPITGRYPGHMTSNNQSKQTSAVRSFHCTSVRRNLSEFFPTCFREANRGHDEELSRLMKEHAHVMEEPPETEGFDPKFGRSWETSDLEVLRNPTLHALWFVLLKERNAMLSADSFFRETLKQRNPYRDRLRSVQQSMDNLKSVLEHRELTVAVVKHQAWLKKVSRHLGADFADDLMRTYLQYNSPTDPEEKEEIEKLKRDQLFSPNHERYHQPYEMWDLKLPGEEREKKEKIVVQYEHDIKWADMEYQYFNPNLWKLEYNQREKARKRIMKRQKYLFKKRFLRKGRSKSRVKDHPYRDPLEVEKMLGKYSGETAVSAKRELEEEFVSLLDPPKP